MVSPESTKRLDYANKIILAPMVRVGTLPMRLMALRHGADIVYTEEIIDWKLLKTYRQENDVLGTIDYIDKYDGNVVFRTCQLERDRVVLQLGTANAERALKIAQMMENDVAAIDINMGCPKEFSIKGGMGAALLSDPERAKGILKTLVDNVSVPVTCKIRLLNDLDETIALVKEFEATGIAAIAVHGRKKNERPQHAVNTEAIRQIAASLKIPVIANGGSRDIERFTDIAKFKEMCGASSVMIARAAEWNVTIFRPKGNFLFELNLFEFLIWTAFILLHRTGWLQLDDVITEYLKLCIDYDNPPTNSKYCVQMMLRELQETPRGKQFLETQTLEDVWWVCWAAALNFSISSIRSNIDFIFAARSGIWGLTVARSNWNIRTKECIVAEHVFRADCLPVPFKWVKLTFQLQNERN